MIELPVGANRVDAADCPGFGIAGSIDDSTDSRIHERASAHRAGLECRIDRHTVKAPMTASRRCRSHGKDLCMGGGIAILFPSVEAAAHELVPGTDGYRSDWNVPALGGRIRLREGVPHPEFVEFVIVDHGSTQQYLDFAWRAMSACWLLASSLVARC